MIRTARKPLRLALLMAVCLSAPALAQDTEEEPLAEDEPTDRSADANDGNTIIVTGTRENYAVDSAVSATKTDVPILRVPQAVAVVPEQVLLDQQVDSLIGALRNVSGITEDNGSFFGDTFTIRGFDNGGAVLRDGYATVQNFAFNAAVERIEVLKGPSSLLYGRFEPGGLVNVITRKPEETFGFNAYAQLSSQGQRRVVGDITGPVSDGLAFRLIAEVEDSEYWRNVGKDRETLFIAPSLSFSSGPFSMLAQYEYLDSERPFDRGRAFFNGERLDTPPDRSFAEDFAEFNQELHTGNLTIGYVFSPQWRVEGKVAIQRGTGEDLQVRPRSLMLDDQGVPTGEFIRSVDGNRDTFDDRDYYSANVHGKFETFGLQHNLLLGADYETLESGTGFRLNSQRRGGFDVFDPVYGLLDQNFAELTVTPNSDSLSTLDTIGIYAQDLIEIDERWTLVLGGRYESFEDFSVFGAAVNPPSDDSSDDTFLPRVGLVYQPRENVSIYASYSQAFAPNSSTPPIGDQPAFGPFPPEESRSYELGVKAQILTGITATAAIYDIEKRNVLVTTEIGDGQTITEARDRITSRGFEFDLVGEVTPELSVIASYAYTDASDPQSALDDNVQNVADHTAGASVNYRFAEVLSGLSLGGGVFYVGERFGGTSAGASDVVSVPFFLDDYITIDLYAGYTARIGSGQEIFGRLTIRNATDANYDQSSGGSLRVAPGQSRTLFGSIGFRF